MIIDNIDVFLEYIPTAEGSDWSVISPFMQDAEYWVQNSFLGDTLFEMLSGRSNTQELSILTSLLAYKAYSLAIPFVDLIQTPNGFAAVQNTNQVPASQARVDRLLQTTLQRVGVIISALMSIIESDNDLIVAWSDVTSFNQMTETVFWKPADMQIYAFMPTVDWQTFSEKLPQVIAFQNDIISDTISPEYMAILISNRRGRTLSDADREVLRRVQVAICMLLSGLNAQAEKQLINLANYMEASLPNFPAYAQSAVYAIKIEEKYTNQPNDNTFFFA
jgi:hypothetical protein